MKLSELKFEMALKPGATDFSMHCDASDCQERIFSQKGLDDVKARLMERYGDVDITVDLDAPWFDRVVINDEQWKEDHRTYCAAKQEWCDKYGCD